MLQLAASPSEVMMCVLAAIVLAGPRTIVAISDDLDEIIQRLDPEQRVKTLGAAKNIQSCFHNIGTGKHQRNHLISDLPEKISEAALPFYLSRANSEVKKSAYIEQLAGYRGTDQALLEEAQSIAAHLLVDSDCNWSRELALISHAYLNGVVTENSSNSIRYRHSKMTQRFPRSIAVQIMEGTDSYPSDLVQAAQVICAGFAADELVPVASVAKRDRWFEDS